MQSSHAQTTMSPPRNLLEILSLTKRDNCRDCGVATCMAFAAQVLQRKRPLEDCPHITAREATVSEPDPTDGEAVRSPASSRTSGEPTHGGHADEMSDGAKLMGIVLLE